MTERDYLDDEVLPDPEGELDDAKTYDALKDDWYEDLPTLGELVDEPSDG